MKPWKRDLAYIREVGPDEPRFDEAVQRVWEALTERDQPDETGIAGPSRRPQGVLDGTSRSARSVSADTEALLATVREALTSRISAPHDDDCLWMTHGKCDCGLAESEARFDGTLAALDSLAAELERLRGAEYMAERWPDKAIALKQRAEAAEAELERVKRAYGHGKNDPIITVPNAALIAEQEWVKAERDDYRDTSAAKEHAYRDAEARLDKALAALRDIKRYSANYQGGAIVHASVVARKALAEIEGEAT